MLNWSLALRTQTDYLSPKGPNFQRAPRVKIDFSGTQIKLKVPRNKSASPDDSVNPQSSYDLSRLQTGLSGKDNNRWRHTILIKRQWDFNGPLLTGCCGFIDMTALISSPEEMTEGLNFFHPRALENGIANYLTFIYGDRLHPSTKEQMWLAPMNWEARTNFSCIAARFDATANRYSLHKGPNSYLILPLSKHQLLIIHCKILRNMSPPEMKPRPLIDEWIDHKPFLELTQQVLDSLEITLSPEAQAQQEEALRGLQDKSLISEFSPLIWTQPEFVFNPDDPVAQKLFNQ